MKRGITFILLAVLLPVMINAKAPRWVSRKPSAENDTYRYVMESASGNTESAALSKAMGQVFMNAISALGLTVSVEKMENAIRTGSFESLATEYKIPVNKVCSYTEGLSSGGVRVYVLCQVAVKSDRVQAVQFTEYRNCGKSEGDIAISGRPDEWGEYDASEYMCASTEGELEKGQSQQEVTMDLVAEARKELILNLNLTADTANQNIISLIQSKTHYHAQTKTIYAIAFVKLDNVNGFYSDKVNEYLTVCRNKMKTVDSYIAEGSTTNARAVMDNIKAKLDGEIMPRLNFLRVHSDDYLVTAYTGAVEQLRNQLLSKDGGIKVGDLKMQKAKIQEYVWNAGYSVRECKLADALRYYYAAQVLLHELADASKVTIVPSEGESAVNANTYIEKSIKSILSDVQISFDGFLPGSETDAKLGFLYKGRAVTNLEYSYNNNAGWSDNEQVRDGWSTVEFVANNRPKSITVKLEYRYADDAANDPELENAIAKHKFYYDDQATHVVPVTNTIMATGRGTGGMSTGSSANWASNTSMNQNVVAEQIKEDGHMVSASDSAKYQRIMDQVCDGIIANNYESIKPLFTANGCTQLDKLLKYGNAKVLARGNCKFIKIGDEVMCRSIPMKFTFRKGKNTTENVVFTFDATGKIDGIQFALEELSARDIMTGRNASETARLALVNFMENYKTAFALKRLGYIESIFADNAVIIIGRMVENTGNVDLGQVKLNDAKFTKYTKKEYMARLATHFKSKEWINIKFSNTMFEKSAQGNYYGIQLLQDYSSNNYGDRGYLFLMIDCSNPDRPLIKVRTWQPESAGARAMNLDEFDEFMRGR